jgi:lysozyme
VNLVDQLKRDEGCRRVTGGLLDYRDSKGLWTRGYGHLMTPQPRDGFIPQVLSEDEANDLLQRDMREHDRDLMEMLPWIVTHPTVVHDAVLNMAFNLGIIRLMGFRDFVAAMRAGNYGLAAIAMLDSKWYREDVRDRAVRLAKQIVMGVYQ